MIYWHSSCRSPKMSTHTRQVVCHCDPLKNWERNIIFYGWCHKKQNKTDLWVGKHLPGSSNSYLACLFTSFEVSVSQDSNSQEEICLWVQSTGLVPGPACFQEISWDGVTGTKVLLESYPDKGKGEKQGWTQGTTGPWPLPGQVFGHPMGCSGSKTAQ